MRESQANHLFTTGIDPSRCHSLGAARAEWIPNKEKKIIKNQSRASLARFLLLSFSFYMSVFRLHLTLCQLTHGVCAMCVRANLRAFTHTPRLDSLSLLAKSCKCAYSQRLVYSQFGKKTKSNYALPPALPLQSRDTTTKQNDTKINNSQTRHLLLSKLTSIHMYMYIRWASALWSADFVNRRAKPKLSA